MIIRILKSRISKDVAIAMPMDSKTVTTANWAQAQSAFFTFTPLDFCSLLQSQRPDLTQRGSNCHDGREQGPDVTGMPTRDFWAICTCLMGLVCCRATWLLLSAPNCHNSRLLQRIAIAFRLFCAHVFCARSLQTPSIAIPPRAC